jgi:acetyltransferase-like isoleucine patch superfamily enzyme
LNKFKNKVIEALELPSNNFHPLVFVSGNVDLGDGVYIGLFSEINGNHCNVKIGYNCDIASFVSINCADSHKLTLGLSESIERKEIIIGDHVFIGSHSFIGGYANIGHHSVIAAGTIATNIGDVPPYSLIVGNPAVIKSGYYKDKVLNGK